VKAPASKAAGSSNLLSMAVPPSSNSSPSAAVNTAVPPLVCSNLVLVAVSSRSPRTTQALRNR